MASRAASPAVYPPSDDTASTADALSSNTPDTSMADSTHLQGPTANARSTPSSLQPVPVDELHDLICIGFGPASLAIAVALQDVLDSREPSPLAHLRDNPPRVAFLEKQPSFAWHAGMQLPGAKMQISWIKDLATMRNPRSRFTFLNYLFQNNRLVPFSNLSTFLPLRAEYEDYMRWCAGHFADVAYSQEAVRIMPTKVTAQGSQANAFAVTTRNLRTNELETRTTQHVVVAAGGKPAIPPGLPQKHPRVIHSSQYKFAVPSLLTQHDAPYRVLVIGGGQSAAETFHDLHARFPHSRTRLALRAGALKPSDDSPFVNEIFDPHRVADTFAAPADTRAADLAENRATNYGVVRLPLLETIYESLYEQRLHHASEADWPHQVLPYRTVTRIADTDDGALRVEMTDSSPVHHGAGEPRPDHFDADLVVVAAGYARNVHEALLADAHAIKPDGGDEHWHVGRDYAVQFKEGTVSPNAGVWLQGCNEETHGLSDTLLSVLATRSWEVVSSIFGGQRA